MFHLITLENCPIFQQLQIEEALLRNTTSNWCIVNHSPPQAIVMGVSGKAEELIDQEYLKQYPIPLIRRFTGGGTVVLDADTALFSLIANEADTGAKTFPQDVARWNSELYHALLPDFALKENDYVLGDKKFGGNAQYLQKGRWLHHSTLLWDYSPSMMRYLLQPKKKPFYRGERTHEAFLCSLKPYFSSPKSVLEALIEELKKRVTLQQSDKKIVQEALSGAHRKNVHKLN